MKKRIIAMLLALAVIIGGCGSDRAPKQYDGRMKETGSGIYYEIWTDTETGVCYLRTSYGGLCVMVNQDGTPFIANGWRDYEE